ALVTRKTPIATMMTSTAVPEAVVRPRKTDSAPSRRARGRRWLSSGSWLRPRAERETSDRHDGLVDGRVERAVELRGRVGLRRGRGDGLGGTDAGGVA